MNKAMNLTIETMTKKNLKEIFNFERDNRQFFERILPPRPQGYYDYKTFKMMMAQILLEQTSGECFMCIIRDHTRKMVGRVNLGSIARTDVVRANLGYRISEFSQGKGYASEAVKLIINVSIKALGIEVFEAGTSTTNIGSQKVLIKNGFTKIGEEKHVMKINNKWVDGLLYEKWIERK